MDLKDKLEKFDWTLWIEWAFQHEFGVTLRVCIDYYLMDMHSYSRMQNVWHRCWQGFYLAFFSNLMQQFSLQNYIDKYKIEK